MARRREHLVGEASPKRKPEFLAGWRGSADSSVVCGDHNAGVDAAFEMSPEVEGISFRDCVGSERARHT